MGQRIRNISVSLLKYVIVSLVTGGQQAAYGTEKAIPPARLATTASEEPVLVATAAQAVGGDMMAMQETKNADTPAEPIASTLERKSIMSLPSLKQRRRKPRMAGIPAGSQAVAQIYKEPGTREASQAVVTADMPVKPQTVAQQDGEAEPPAPVKPQTGAQTMAQEAEETEDQLAPVKQKPQAVTQEKTKTVRGGGKQYRMAPIRWGVRVSETLGWLRESNSTGNSGNPIGSTTFSNVQTAEVKLSSYILQQYIAQVNGSLGVVRDSSRKSATNSTTHSNQLFGSGGLALFSRSRFPFTMSFNSTNSLVNDELVNSNMASNSLNMRQSYRPPTGISRYNAGYNFNSADSKSSGKSSRSLWDGSYSTRLGSAEDQPFYANMRHTRDTESRGGSVTGTSIVSATHNYLPSDSLLSLNTQANLTATSQKNPAQPSISSKYMQINTVAQWQPESEDIPLVVTGNGRIFNAMNTSGGVMSRTQSLGGDVAANYMASRNISYNGGLGVTYTDAKNTANLITTQRGSASYRSDPVKVKNMTHSWNASGGASNTSNSGNAFGTASSSGSATGTGSTAGTASGSGSAVGSAFNSNRSVFLGGGHSLAWLYNPNFFGTETQLRFGFNQSLNVVSDKLDGKSETIVNSGALGWSSSRSESLSSGASVSISDTRKIGGLKPLHNQIILIGLNGLGKYHTSVYGATVDADATVLVARDSNGKMQTTPEGHVKATYNKGNVFGVRRLGYEGLLDVNVRKPADTYGQPSGTGTLSQKPVSYRLDQRLSYRVGQNEIRLTGSLLDENGVKNASLFLQLRAWRTIGN